MPIAPIVGAGIVAGVGALAGSAIKAHEDGNAANIQATAAQKALDLQTQIFNTQTAARAPYQAAGTAALGRLGSGQYGVQPGAVFNPANFSGGAPVRPSGVPTQTPQLTTQPSIGGMVTLRSPNGTIQQVSPNQVAAYQPLGYTVVG